MMLLWNVEETFTLSAAREVNCQTIIHTVKYDPKVDKWTELKPVTISDRPDESMKNAFAIYGDLYLATSKHILKYDVKKNDLVALASFPDMEIHGAVLVKMSD